MSQQTRRSYTDDFKTQAVTLAESIGRGEAARQFDISVKTLGNWLDTARNGRPLSLNRVMKILGANGLMKAVSA